MQKEKFKPDNWQREVLEYEGNIAIRAGRQVGKSTIIAKKAAFFARDHPNTVTLVIAASQKQSGWLFDKIVGELSDMEETRKVKIKGKPTRTKVELKNGSIVHSLPAGRTGWFIRGLALDMLICDEAAFISDAVFTSVDPMIAVSRKKRGLGWIILLSTPFGKGGYFYDACQDKDFKQFHLSSENCPRIPKDYLKKRKQMMTKADYAQEFLGEFTDSFNQFFNTGLIKKCMTFIEWNFNEEYSKLRGYYMGVDVARYGGSENAFVIAEMGKKKNLKIVKVLTTERMSITDTIGRIMKLNEKFNFKRIFIDDGGVGGGLTDVLIEKLGRRIIGLNNAKRSVNKDNMRKSILKEDLYSNALMMMEAGKIEMLSDLPLLKSLKSIVFEYRSEGTLKIYGNYSHIAEAFVRVCWSIKDKGLDIFLM